MSRVLFVSGVSFHAAYSGTKYLLSSLSDAGFELFVCVPIKKEDAAFYDQLPYRVLKLVHRKKKFFLWQKLYTFISVSRIFWLMVQHPIIIISEGTWLPYVWLLKKIFKAKKVIHFCQELWLTEDHAWSQQARLFDRYAQIPDLVIDVNEPRAAFRQNRFHLARVPLVLLNTLPEYEVAPKAEVFDLFHLANLNASKLDVIVFYAGGVGVEKPFERIIDSIALVESKITFVAFCNASATTIRDLNMYAKTKLSHIHYAILPSVKREIILSISSQADIGILDYAYQNQPTNNQLYCAPTKFFEYMASGLALVTSNNPPLVQIITEEKIGAYASDDSPQAFAKAVDSLACDIPALKLLKERSRSAFQRKYSYEKACKQSIIEITHFIEENYAKG